MKKRLVFFVYVDSFYKESVVYDIHFENLKRYCGIFDSATIYLSLKVIDEENLDFARNLAKRIIDCGFIKDVEFKIRENTIMREVDCFKDEVIYRIINNVPELVFFTHTKGISNNLNLSLFKWICGMYYFNLNFMNEVEYSLVYKPIYDTANSSSVFYGFPLLYSTIGNYIKNNVFYAGTIYWINCAKASQYNRCFDINPKTDYIYSTRCFAEEFPGDYFLSVVSSGHFLKQNGEFSLYDDFELQMEKIYMNNSYIDKNNFNNYCDEIQNSISLFI